MLVLSHNDNLVDNQLFLRLRGQIHLLNCNLATTRRFDGGEHKSRCALANFVEVSIAIFGVAYCDNVA